MSELLATAEQLADIGSWELHMPSMTAIWSDGLFRIHGLDPQTAEPGIDLLNELVHPVDRERVMEVVQGAINHPASVPPDGIRLEYRVVLADGSERTLRALGRVELDPEGQTARWFGVAQDVTEMQQSERDLQAHYGVSQALRDWESFEEGVVDLLRRMGTALAFPIGALWTLDSRHEQVVCRAFWSAPDVELGDFAAATHQLTFRPGEPIPGRVFATGEPWFIPELADEPHFPRLEEATGIGLRSGLIFPAIDGGEPVAAMSFYSFDRRERSLRLERTLQGIGHELGRFLSRRRAQLSPSPLSARELEVIRLAAEGQSGPKIAAQLFVSPSTIKTHFENIYEKLGVSDRAGAVALSMRMGLIT
jgi:DNA-binding CsgD family transcriptional regulator